jgi:hypothetical protein
MRLGSHWLTGGLAVGLGVLSGWASAGAGGSIERAPTAVLIMAAGLGTAGLVVGALSGLRRRTAWWAVLVLLGSFYVGTWLNSPHHSPAGDAIVLVLAAVPTCIGLTLGFAVGRYLATRGPLTPRL